MGRFDKVRRTTDELAAPLSPEDQVIQSMTDASPTKWHRAHTTWFFETFLLSPHLPGYDVFDPEFGYLFNSYYEAVGARHPRPERGLLTRPSCEQVAKYRSHVDAAMADLIAAASDEDWPSFSDLIELGINHEQQHQELLLMDILHGFSCNPLEPAFARTIPLPTEHAPDLSWTEVPGGLKEIGVGGDQQDHRFYFDNEGPRHQVHLESFRLANRLVTNEEWLAFMADDGYRRPEFWLSDGWAYAQAEGWCAPLYWREEEAGQWSSFGLRGRQPINLDAPMCHISFYEAEAYAAWAGKRLPTEQEWEVAAASLPIEGNLLPHGALRALPTKHQSGLQQMFGDVWEFTRSPYLPYPGFKVAPGAIGEYNGKFMANQMVLRGGCCVTPGDHVRPTYRNFFYPHQRWMFAGLRLAEDA